MKTFDCGLIWFVHALQNLVAEASFLLGVSERTVQRYISKFLVTGDIKSAKIGRSYGSIHFAPREELIICEAVLSNPDKHSWRLQKTFTSRPTPYLLYLHCIIIERGVELRTKR